MKVRLPLLLFIANLLPVGLGPICFGETIVVCVGKGLSSFPTDLSENIYAVVLSENNLTDLNAADLKKYPRLISLLLDHNKIITSHSLRGISQLKQLQEIDLSCNDMTLIDFQVFEENLQLESITANENYNIEIADTAVDLPNIKNVSFENCKLYQFPLKALSKFGGLENLHLRWNNITTVPGNLTTLFPKLKKLWISNNPLSSIDPELCHVVDVTTHPSCSFETKPVIQSLPETTATSFLGAEENSFEDVEPTTEKRSTTTTTNAVTESKKEAKVTGYFILVVVLLCGVGCFILYYKHFFSSRQNEKKSHPEEIPIRDNSRQQS